MKNVISLENVSHCDRENKEFRELQATKTHGNLHKLCINYGLHLEHTI